EQRRGPLRHHASKVVGPAFQDRDQLADVGTAGGCRRERLRLHEVPGDELDAARSKMPCALRAPCEHPHLELARAQRVHDRRPDEARPAGDEDLHSSKFFQYRLGVGPRCPWYLEPSAVVPYGADAGSVSCMNDSWPIFMRW